MKYPNLGEMMTIQAKRWKNKPLVRNFIMPIWLSHWLGLGSDFKN